MPLSRVPAANARVCRALIIATRRHDALLDIVPLVRAQLDASCPLVETCDETFRDGAEGLP